MQTKKPLTEHYLTCLLFSHKKTICSALLGVPEQAAEPAATAMYSIRNEWPKVERYSSNMDNHE